MAKLGPSNDLKCIHEACRIRLLFNSSCRFVVDNSRMRLIFWTSPCASIEACRIWVISGKKKEPTFWTWGSHRLHVSVMFEDLCGDGVLFFFSFLRWCLCHSNASQFSLTKIFQILALVKVSWVRKWSQRIDFENWWEMEFMQAALESFITVWRLVNCEDCVWKWHCQMSSNNLHSRLLDLWPLSPPVGHRGVEAAQHESANLLVLPCNSVEDILVSGCFIFACAVLGTRQALVSTGRPFNRWLFVFLWFRVSWLEIWDLVQPSSGLCVLWNCVHFQFSLWSTINSLEFPISLPATPFLEISPRCPVPCWTVGWHPCGQHKSMGRISFDWVNGREKSVWSSNPLCSVVSSDLFFLGCYIYIYTRISSKKLQASKGYWMVAKE